MSRRSAVCLGLAMLAGPVTGHARNLNADFAFTQYKHTRWTADQGAPAPIFRVAQGKDGYLWLATGRGAYRFDGVRFEKIPPVAGMAPDAGVQSLFVARDGTVWIGYRNGGIAVYREGAFHDAGLGNWPWPNHLLKFEQAADGSIWAAANMADRPLAHYRNGHWERYGTAQGLPADPLNSMVLARDGTLWEMTDRAIVFLRKGATRFFEFPATIRDRAAWIEDEAGRIWQSDTAGTRVIHPVASRGVPYPSRPFWRAQRIMADRDGNFWSTDAVTGIWVTGHPDPAGAASRAAAAAAVHRFDDKDGLTSNGITSLILDREGNIWASSLLGLDQFRKSGVTMEPDLTKSSGYGLFTGADGTVYVSQDQLVSQVRPGGRPQVLVREAAGNMAGCGDRNGGIWVSLGTRIVHFDHGRREALPLPLPGEFFASCLVDARYGLLISVTTDGVLARRAGQWHRLPVPYHSDEDAVMAFDRDRRLIVYSDGKMFVCGDIDHCAPLAMPPGHPLYNIRATAPGRSGLLLGGSLGLLRVQGDRVQFLSAGRFPALAGITGLITLPSGDIWLVSDAGIVRVTADEIDRAFADPRATIAPMVLNTTDGLPGIAIWNNPTAAVQGGDGRLWFALSGGVISIDPARFPRNRIAPQVAIGSLKIAGATYLDPVRLTLPAGTSSGEIDFAALSLTIPSRTQVLYQLEGQDAGWIDPGPRRQMFFSNLGPGTYHFRVIAANDNGLWNRTGASIDFTIPPTFFQSVWARLLAALAIGGALWLIYAMRLRQMALRMRAGHEVQIAERERIARELHDTLLQGFHGLLLHFQSAANRLPRDEPVRHDLEQALDRAETVLAEGRDRVRDLRATTGDLAETLARTAQDMAVTWPAAFALAVEGTPRPLDPAAAAEIEYIGQEAVRNAFRHARARSVDAVLTYRAGELRLHVRDDGIGFPADPAATGGRDGHYGLVGMRERAARIGARLVIDGQACPGTRVTLAVPAASAYAAGRRRWWQRPRRPTTPDLH